MLLYVRVCTEKKQLAFYQKAKQALKAFAILRSLSNSACKLHLKGHNPLFGLAFCARQKTQITIPPAQPLWKPQL